VAANFALLADCYSKHRCTVVKSEVRSSYHEKDFHTTNLEIDDVIFCIFSVGLNVIGR